MPLDRAGSKLTQHQQVIVSGNIRRMIGVVLDVDDRRCRIATMYKGQYEELDVPPSRLVMFGNATRFRA